MLAAYADNRGWIPVSRYYDVVDETRKRRHAADKERSNGAPVGGDLGLVAVNTMEPVHVRHGHVASPDDEVAAVRYVSAHDYRKVALWSWGYELGHENRRHRTQEDRVATKESKEPLSRSEDFPLRLWSAVQ